MAQKVRMLLKSAHILNEALITPKGTRQAK